MTAGIPGAGIGGLFYLLSALGMPFHELWVALRGRSTVSGWCLVKRQASLAVCILASIGGTAWFLSAVFQAVSRSAMSAGAGPYIGEQAELPRLLSYSAFALTLTTLGMILTSVQLLRFVVSSRRVAHRPRSRRLIPRPQVLFAPGRLLALLFFLIVHPTASAQTAAPRDSRANVTQHLARADAAFKAEDSVAAEREYRAVLELDPDQSRAVFRLAQLLERTHPTESERFFRRYLELEPDDPWGYIVFAESLGHAGRYRQALEEYAEAIRRAPRERDAVLGKARMLGRAGRTDQAIAAYEQWLSLRADDGEAWRELARERLQAGRLKGAYAALRQASRNAFDEGTEERLEALRRSAAPAFEPMVGFSGDSEGNRRLQTTLGGDFAVGDDARLGVTVGRTRVSDSSDSRSFSEFGVTTRWRPRVAVELTGRGGAAFLGGTRDDRGAQRPAHLLPTASVRLRAAVPGGAARLDVRFNRNLVDATRMLVANRVVRNEALVRPDFAISRRVRLRALGGAGSIHGGGEQNSRYTLGGGAGWNVRPAVELSANYTEIGYAHPSQVGYFAPRRSQRIEAGSYMEFGGRTALLALDLGAGAERVQTHGAAFGSWRPSLRAYALLSFAVHPGCELRWEAEGYDTQAGPALAPASGWKYGSVAVSFRWALP